MRVRRHLTAAISLAMLTATLSQVSVGGASAAVDTVVRDGSTSGRAAASCWGIKQQFPASTSKIYWLQTPKMVIPQKFYCDMETAGGGWVLVGRGRDGWSFADGGQGTTSAVSATINGTAAFAPAALSTQTIDGLLNGAPVDTLDGIRVRRATNTAGSAWQEMRLYTDPGQGGWSWAFGGGIKLRAVTQDLDAEGPAAPRTYTEPSNAVWDTRDWRPGTPNDLTRMWTFSHVSKNYRMGFGFGTAVAGTTVSTSYLWRFATENSPLPFAQVWLRPQLSNLTFDAPATSGAAAESLRPLMSNRTSTTTPWGVTGVVDDGIGNTVKEQNLEVQALEPMGDTMYVGGKFQYVQQGAAGAQTERRYLAAFDVDSGAWRSGFLPQLNGQVWDIQVMGDKLIISGDFTTVNGQSSPGIAAIDPTTGALLTTWKASLAYTSATQNSPLRGRAMDVQGGWLYVGGNFNRAWGGIVSPVPADNPVRMGHLTRFRVTDGKPDASWKPSFAGGVADLDASAAGDRVYVAGSFRPSTDLNQIQAAGAAVLRTTSPVGLAVPTGWYKPVSSQVSGQYQQTVRETAAGDAVWLGGAQHNMQRYERANMALQRGHVTRSGGDLQAQVEIDGVVYGACHCDRYSYTDAYVYDGNLPAPPAYSRVDPILWIGAWDAQTGAFLPEFAVSGLRSRAGNGPWDLTKDRNGCMWFGGDLVGANGTAWLGGFGKVCARDTTAPTTPTSLTSSKNVQTGVIKLLWGASTDNAGAVSYELVRNDRMVNAGAWAGREFTDPDAKSGDTYWVRAIDAAGNRSATTAAYVVP